MSGRSGYPRHVIAKRTIGNDKRKCHRRKCGDGETRELYSVSVTDESGALLIENEPLELGRPIPLSSGGGEGTFGDYDIDQNGCTLKSIALTDADGNAGKVFPFDAQPKKLRLDFSIGREGLNACCGVMFVNRDSGETLLADVRKYRFEAPCESLSFEYDFSDIMLGAGEYNISFMIYERIEPLDNRFQEYLVRLDRTYSFKIEPRTDYLLSTPLVYAPIAARAYGNGDLGEETINYFER